MNCKETKELLPGMLDGALEPGQGASVEAHCASCPACAAELSALKKAAGFVKEFGEEDPPPWLKTRIMAHIREESVKKRGFFERLFSPDRLKMVAQVSVVLCVAALGVYIYESVPGSRLNKAVEAPATFLPAAAPESDKKAVSGMDELAASKPPEAKKLDRIAEPIMKKKNDLPAEEKAVAKRPAAKGSGEGSLTIESYGGVGRASKPAAEAGDSSSKKEDVVGLQKRSGGMSGREYESKTFGAGGQGFALKGAPMVTAASQPQTQAGGARAVMAESTSDSSQAAPSEKPAARAKDGYALADQAAPPAPSITAPAASKERSDQLKRGLVVGSLGTRGAGGPVYILKVPRDKAASVSGAVVKLLEKLGLEYKLEQLGQGAVYIRTTCSKRSAEAIADGLKKYGDLQISGEAKDDGVLVVRIVPQD